MVADTSIDSEYHQLVDKVTAFTRAAFDRRRADMACAAGCSSCCAVWLTVNAVEAAELRVGLAALSSEARARVSESGKRELEREANANPGSFEVTPRCAMLEADGRCAVYEYRPLVCRTQGHALRYPADFVPEGAVRARTETGEVTHCPLNFTQAAPHPEDVLDAERVDQILAVVTERFARAHGIESTARVALSELAAST